VRKAFRGWSNYCQLHIDNWSTPKTGSNDARFAKTGPVDIYDLLIFGGAGGANIGSTASTSSVAQNAGGGGGGCGGTGGSGGYTSNGASVGATAGTGGLDLRTVVLNPENLVL
jgi:hypothetical protein